MFSLFMRTRGDMLSFAIAFALRGARKLVRALRDELTEELTEEERYRVANDVMHRLKQHGDPARKRALCTRALRDLEAWLAGAMPVAAE